ncbi:MAG: PAS domain S-box protein, partial [Desulfobacterales bacterium]|nr:PAS domain S-box protein [Desulfobacterales bacterium]
MRAFAAIPMRHENRIIGCLNLASHDKNNVPVFSRHALEAIVAQLGISIARIRAEEAMRKSEERYRILFEQDPDAIILSDMKDRIIDVNPKACKLTGYTRDELVNMKVTDFLTQELRRKKGEVFSHTIEKYQGLPFDGSSIHKDGTRMAVEIKTVFLAIEGLILAIVRDITERKKGEQALRESEEKHRVLIETMNEGLLVQDKNDAITYINNK